MWTHSGEGKMINSVVLLYNPHKDGIKTKLFDLKEAFMKAGIEVAYMLSTETEYAVYGLELYEQDSGKDLKPDMIVVLGGDGSVLRSLPLAVKKDIPVAGINFGKFGFMTRYKYNRVLEDPKILNDSKISERALLKIISDGENGESKACLALNDVVLQRVNLNLVEMYEIGVNGSFFEPKAADGVVISTPTGSTAYSLSLGGPIIFPECATMQLNLIAPHTIANRPVIFNSEESITVSLTNGDIMKVSVDGLPLEEAKKVRVCLSDRRFKLSYPKDDELLKLIETKLFWGRRG